jgi:hypothetical protein
LASFTPNPELAGPLYGKDPWPLRFHTHAFNAVCFNTLGCSIVYNGHEFGTRKIGYDGQPHDEPSGPPPFEGWLDKWHGRHGIMPTDGETFPGPLELDWTSLDGTRHADSVDFDEIFKDRIVLHGVARDEVKEEWLDAKSIDPVNPNILVEVNDRTINVFMRAMIATNNEQIPGNDRSHFRDDVFLAWTHTY